MKKQYVKFRYWVIILVLIAGAGIYSTIRLIGSEQYSKVDMVEINERFTKIEAELDAAMEAALEAAPMENSGMSSEYNKTSSEEKQMSSEEKQIVAQGIRQELEQQYQCTILYRTDAEYESELFNAIRNQKVILDYEIEGQIAAKVIFDGQQEKVTQLCKDLTYLVVWIVLGMFVFVLLILFVIYSQYVRPFKKMQRFAGNISKGNFDIPLPIKKNNYFGAFTESFDIMREELKRARKSEFDANTSKKELVASLSHDIKTPVATIKAICEILMLKIKDEATLEKIVIINQKAGVIDSLISDMFHATLEDLEKLKIEPTEELSTIIQPMFDEINHYEKIHYVNAVPECLVIADRLRLNQVIDNIINNSYKYAMTDIDVTFEKIGHELCISIQDHGAGIEEEELPLAEQKFFRGSNAKGQNGSGLGLYLSKTFMEGMGGSMEIENHDGFMVKLAIKMA